MIEIEHRTVCASVSEGLCAVAAHRANQAHADAASHLALVGLHHAYAGLAQPVDILRRRLVFPHLHIHCGDGKHGFIGRENQRGAEIVGNAGSEPSVILREVREKSGSYGYNAQTGQYGDMLEMGIIDPTKVTRTALQNAASIAGLMLTTEVMVAEKPADSKKSAAAHGAHEWE